MRRPNDPEARVPLRYDIHGFLSDVYVNRPHALEEKTHTLVLRDSDVKTNWPDFAKYVVWYGRMGWSSYKDDATTDSDSLTD